MLIGIKKRFIFIANTRTASTSIEMFLKGQSDIALTKPEYGKHFKYAAIVRKFHFIFDEPNVPASGYFRFGVVREPLEWVVSWYNYRRRKELPEGNPNSCRTVRFEEFAEEVMAKETRPFARIGRQIMKFLDGDGVSLGVDYLIPLPRIHDDFRDICQALNIGKEPQLDRKVRNASPATMSAGNVDASLAKRLRDHFAEDADLFRRTEERAFGDARQIIQRKLNRA
jgi:Sulfotransferase family